MLQIHSIDLSNRQEVNEFIQFPFELYKDVPQWVPPFRSDQRTMLNPQKHPFYEHSEAAFFIAKEGNEVLGRIAAIENKPFNETHDVKKAQFYFFDSINDQEIANALFNHAFEWSRQRGLSMIVGPKGLSAFDGYGIQIEGTELRQMMTMMTYNFPYYQALVENLGFEKEVDFVSCAIDNKNFNIPEKAQRVADRVRERGKFKVIKFDSKRELSKWVKPIGRAYNDTFIHNWEYYPLTDREIDFAFKDIMMVADPKLIKIITYEDDVVGFLFAFPDISAALQRQKGRITPWGVMDMLREFKRTNIISLNGAGVLPKFQGGGGNALLYSEMAETLKASGQFLTGELTQVAETTQQMRKDLITMGGRPYKNHRVYKKSI